MTENVFFYIVMFIECNSRNEAGGRSGVGVNGRAAASRLQQLTYWSDDSAAARAAACIQAQPDRRVPLRNAMDHCLEDPVTQEEAEGTKANTFWFKARELYFRSISRRFITI